MPATAEKEKFKDIIVEENFPEDIIRKYKILDEKCEEVLKKIKKKRKTSK